MILPSNPNPHQLEEWARTRSKGSIRFVSEFAFALGGGWMLMTSFLAISRASSINLGRAVEDLLGGSVFGALAGAAYWLLNEHEFKKHVGLRR